MLSLHIIAFSFIAFIFKAVKNDIGQEARRLMVKVPPEMISATGSWMGFTWLGVCRKEPTCWPMPSWPLWLAPQLNKRPCWSITKVSLGPPK